MADPGPRRDVRRLIGEFAMLVIGVMVALSADSWWQDRRAGAEIQSLLIVLEAELEENRRSLTAALNYRARLLDQNRALVRVAVSGPPFPASDSLIPLVYSPLEGGPPSLSFGAYEVLLSRGSTEFVDAEFLTRLASHVSVARQGQSEDDGVRQDVGRLITDAIARNGGFLSITSDPFRIERGLPSPPDQLDAAGLLGDPEFQNAATIAAILHYNWQTWLEERLAETDLLLTELR